MSERMIYQIKILLSWWISYTLMKRDIILSYVKSYIRKTTHKYGIEIPTSIEHVHMIDTKDENHFLRDVINLDIFNNGVALKF